MNERLMQFIWQGRYFGQGPYFTIQGEPLEIIYPGIWNVNQGPDFLDAKLKIGKTIWAGNIELHIRASDWHRHLHHTDPNFQNIILHVVWDNDACVLDRQGTAFACFCLQPFVSKILLERYQTMMLEQNFFLPCQHYLLAIDGLHWLSWKERLIAERLEKKSERIQFLLKETRQDWETVFWWLLAGNFGLKVNASLFESIARTIPIKIIYQHKQQIQQLEALLLGQANLLSGNFEESYPVMLQKEFHFLRKKYQLAKVLLQPAFLRMRPAAFPGLRLAQLAMLMHKTDHLFATLKEVESLQNIQEIFRVHPNDYWLYHYRLDEPLAYQEKKLGQQMINSILINTVVPVIFSYGKVMKEEKLKDRALGWLSEIAPEQNRIVQQWTGNKVINGSAFDSQALLELSHQYCEEKRCLDCAVGAAVLKQS